MDTEARMGQEALPVITVITPTADRPAAWPLIERWMANQTIQPGQWIVADDGEEPAPLTMGQTHIRRPRKEVGGASLAKNILAAIPHVQGQIVVICEDDDYLKPNHIEVSTRMADSFGAAGCIWLNYYNLKFQAWRRIRNTCAALCNTAFHVEHLEKLADAAEESLYRKIYHVDRLFWQRVSREGLHEIETVVGIKGIPGMPGIGIGHKTSGHWNPDRDGSKLREWIGEDADLYGR